MSTDDHACIKKYPEACPITRTVRLIGDMWTLMIVYNLMSGTKRFGELLDALGNVSPKTLSQRLKMLEKAEFVHRQAYAEIPPRVVYQLTEKGRALVDIIAAMQAFGERFLADPDPTTLSSEGCPSNPNPIALSSGGCPTDPDPTTLSSEETKECS